MNNKAQNYQFLLKKNENRKSIIDKNVVRLCCKFGVWGWSCYSKCDRKNFGKIIFNFRK